MLHLQCGQQQYCMLVNFAVAEDLVRLLIVARSTDGRLATKQNMTADVYIQS